MMGNTAEFYADQRALDPAAEPDRLIGEDVIPAGVYVGAEAGLRNMGDPRADGDPDPYSERSTSTSDNGGVHANSGIPNHVYHLAVVGGRNAGCDVGGSGGPPTRLTARPLSTRSAWCVPSRSSTRPSPA